jgi:hypothetical protein
VIIFFGFGTFFGMMRVLFFAIKFLGGGHHFTLKSNFLFLFDSGFQFELYVDHFRYLFTVLERRRSIDLASCTDGVFGMNRRFVRCRTVVVLSDSVFNKDFIVGSYQSFTVL